MLALPIFGPRASVFSRTMALVVTGAIACLVWQTPTSAAEPAKADAPAKQAIKTLAVLAPGEEAPNVSGATHQQTKLIHPAEGDSKWRLTSFCLSKDGRIIAALSHPEPIAEGDAFPAVGEAADKPSKKPEEKPQSAIVGELRLLDPDAKLVKKWSLDFEPQAVSAAPDGTIVVGGDGVLARYDLEGKQLARAESPQIAATKQDPKALEEQARALLEQQQNQYKQIIKSLEDQKDQFKDKDDKSLSDEERQLKTSIDAQIKAYKQIEERQTGKINDEQVKLLAASLAKQDRRVNAIAAGKKYVFTTTRTSKGYGYRVWRTDLDFTNPKQIVDGLSGCCGQMDVQCCDDDLVVAENSRYRVVRYDVEGKKVDSFGKSSREGDADGFSGCCNPMNTRAAGDKLYVSESNGVVKLFSKDGKYEGVVGVAQVRPGCKSSIVDVSSDGNRVYYIDVNNSAICLLERTAEKTAAK